MNPSPKMFAMVARALARQHITTSRDEQLAMLIASQTADDTDNFCSTSSLPANELTWRDRRDYY